MMIEKEIKPKKPPSYFEKQKELIEKDYRGKSKRYSNRIA